MTPLPTNPNVIVLTDENNVVIRIATNVASDLNVVVTRSNEVFEAKALGSSFNFFHFKKTDR